MTNRAYANIVFCRKQEKAVSGELFQIETVKEYAADYYACIDEAKAEMQQKARPELKQYLDDISEYDNIFICGLCWWGPFPMAIYSQVRGKCKRA